MSNRNANRDHSCHLLLIIEQRMVLQVNNFFLLCTHCRVKTVSDSSRAPDTRFSSATVSRHTSTFSWRQLELPHCPSQGVVATRPLVAATPRAAHGGSDSIRGKTLKETDAGSAERSWVGGMAPLRCGYIKHVLALHTLCLASPYCNGGTPYWNRPCKHKLPKSVSLVKALSYTDNQFGAHPEII